MPWVPVHGMNLGFRSYFDLSLPQKTRFRWFRHIQTPMRPPAPKHPAMIRMTPRYHRTLCVRLPPEHSIRRYGRNEHEACHEALCRAGCFYRSSTDTILEGPPPSLLKPYVLHMSQNEKYEPYLYIYICILT